MPLRISDRRKQTLTVRDRLAPLPELVTGAAALAAMAALGTAEARVSVTGGAPMSEILGAGDVDVQPWDPTQASEVGAWLRNTTTSGGVSSWTSMLDSDHAVQTQPTRQPAGGTANGFPISTFAANDSMVWPLNAVNNRATSLGFAGWLNQPVSALETLFCIYNAAGGASARKLFLQTNTGRRLVFGVYDAGGLVRQAMTVTDALPPPGTWAWFKFWYDSTLPGDSKFSISVDLVPQSLTFSGTGTPGLLLQPTGNALWGNLQNTTGALVPYNGSFGPNLFTLIANPSPATEANLRAFESPLAA